jgi:transcriptional regulator with XRE-family HTH domain
VEKKYQGEIKKFGLHIKKLRNAIPLTQQELADRCEVDIRTIQRIERGDYGLGLHIVLALAEAFETTPDLLFAGIHFK